VARFGHPLKALKAKKGVGGTRALAHSITIYDWYKPSNYVAGL